MAKKPEDTESAAKEALEKARHDRIQKATEEIAKVCGTYKVALNPGVVMTPQGNQWNVAVVAVE